MTVVGPCVRFFLFFLYVYIYIYIYISVGEKLRCLVAAIVILAWCFTIGRFCETKVADRGANNYCYKETDVVHHCNKHQEVTEAVLYEVEGRVRSMRFRQSGQLVGSAGFVVETAQLPNDIRPKECDVRRHQCSARQHKWWG